MKNKKIVTMVIAIIAILILAGGVCGYLYFGTDTFKSDKERFFKYLGQNSDISKMLEDDLSTEYAKKKTEKAFENNGEIKINSNTGESSVDNAVKDIGISIEGKTDNKNKKVQQDVTVNYSSSKAAVRYVQDGDKFAIKSDLIGNDYVGIENNNLKDLAEKMGVKDTSKIPNKIDLETLQGETFTKDELKKIYNTYYDIIVNEFEDGDFTKTTENNQTAYKLTVTDTKLLAVTTKVLETLKNDTLILEKIVKFSSEEYTVEQLQSKIGELLDELKDETTENKEVMTITVYEENGKLVKTEIKIAEIDNSSANIIITKSDDSAKIEMTIVNDGETATGTLDISKVKENSDLKYNVEFSVKADDSVVKFFVKAEYANIKGMKEVSEKYVIGLEGTQDSTNINMDLTIANNVKFVDSVETESLSDTKLLNDYSEEELQKIFTALAQLMQKTSSTSSLVDSNLTNTLDVDDNEITDTDITDDEETTNSDITDDEETSDEETTEEEPSNEDVTDEEEISDEESTDTEINEEDTEM